ncbi:MULTISPECIES: hypothetical protein [Streptomyces]|uniref:hypothetical protein n=1 Tax=Streptomyces TaxID=1883 RepID=UPI00292DDA07|nr:hypothetical protein [Streptomyces sp. NEAU-HV9]
MNNPYSTPTAPRSANTRPWYKRKRVWAASVVVFGLGAMGGNQSAQDEVNAAKAAAAKPRPTITVTATATVTELPKAAPAPTVTKTRTVKKPGPTVTVTKAAQNVSGADHSNSGSSGTGTCSITSNAGNCYQAGQYCRNSDHGAVTTTAGGTSIRCSYSSGAWRWTYA